MSEHKHNPLARGTTVPPIVRDLYGRSLVEGDKVSLHLQVPSLFQIQSITPSVDPKMPPNMMEVVVACRLRFIAVRDQPNAEFCRVIAASESPTAPPLYEAPRLSLVPEGDSA